MADNNDRRTKALDRLVKLMETANRSKEEALVGTSEDVAHEELAENANRRMAKIMRRLQITEAELAAHQQLKQGDKRGFEIFKFSLSNAYGLGKERSSALHWAAIVPFGATSMRTVNKSAKVDTVITVFAPKIIADTLKSLLYSLSLQLEEGMRAAVKEERKRLDSVYYLTQSKRNQEILEFRRGYIRAFSSTVGSRVKAAQDEAMAEVKKELAAEGMELSSSTELVLAESHKKASDFMNFWYADNNRGAKLRKTSSRARGSWRGVDAGRIDGRKADITPPKADSSRRALPV